MSRYFTRPPRADRIIIEDERFDNEWSHLPDLRVCDHEATDTGLLDHNGDVIMRAANPVGFGKDHEW